MTQSDETTKAVQPDELDTGEVVERIIAIWTELLGVAGITPESNLLDLGATSLTAVKVRSQLRAELGRDVDLGDLLDYPTPRELAPIVVESPVWDSRDEWDSLDWSDEEELS